jgi:hypothetical protein
MPTDKNLSGVELKLFWQTDRLTPVVHEKLGFALHGLSITLAYTKVYAIQGAPSKS